MVTAKSITAGSPKELSSTSSAIRPITIYYLGMVKVAPSLYSVLTVPLLEVSGTWKERAASHTVSQTNRYTSLMRPSSSPKALCIYLGRTRETMV